MTSSDANTDEAKGRLKEAAGSLTGDDDLKDEGKIEQASASVKEKADQAKQKFDEVVDSVKDRISSDD